MKEREEIKKRIKSKRNISRTSTSENKNIIKVFIIKLIIVVLIFLSFTILIRTNKTLKNKVYNYVYNTNISFSKIKKFYNAHIGNILPFENIVDDKEVFSEKLEYKKISTYNKGVKLTVSDNYAVPIIKEGIVIFIGKKEKIGNTVIIQQSDGIDVWYSNLSNINVKLYDYVKTNKIVGEVKNNTLYLEFQKDGVNIDYKEVLK